MSAGYPSRQNELWSDQKTPGTHDGAATPSEGNRAWRRNAATPRRTSARDATSPTKPMKSPRLG